MAQEVIRELTAVIVVIGVDVIVFLFMRCRKNRAIKLQSSFKAISTPRLGWTIKSGRFWVFCFHPTIWIDTTNAVRRSYSIGSHNGRNIRLANAMAMSCQHNRCSGTFRVYNVAISIQCWRWCLTKEIKGDENTSLGSFCSGISTFYNFFRHT